VPPVWVGLLGLGRDRSFQITRQRRRDPAQRGWSLRASSALISRAGAFRVALEPLIPLLRKVRRDIGFPAAASLLALRRTWLVSV